MAMTTEAPVALVSADNWTIADVRIDPALPAVVYQIVARLGNEEVRRTTVSVVGAELIDSPEMAQLYGTIKSLLYFDAMARGHIPAEAKEPAADANVAVGIAGTPVVEVNNGTSE